MHTQALKPRKHAMQWPTDMCTSKLLTHFNDISVQENFDITHWIISSVQSETDTQAGLFSHSREEVSKCISDHCDSVQSNVELPCFKRSSHCLHWHRRRTQRCGSWLPPVFFPPDGTNWACFVQTWWKLESLSRLKSTWQTIIDLVHNSGYMLNQVRSVLCFTKV